MVINLSKFIVWHVETWGYVKKERMDKCPSVEKKVEKEKEKCKIKMIAHDLYAWRKLFIVSKERYLFQGAK
jgi:hypothetical protein